MKAENGNGCQVLELDNLADENDKDSNDIEVEEVSNEFIGG